jgi:uncharacterized protein YqkB
MKLFFKHKTSEKTTRYESKPMTRFWATNLKINSESDGNEVLVTNSISTQNLNKELTPKSRLRRMTKSLRNVFALMKDKWNNCFVKSSMSSNRSLESIFRKLEKNKFSDSKILDLLQEIEINIESIEDQQNNEIIVKILTLLSTHENLLVRKNSDFLLNKVSKEVIETKNIFDVEMVSTEEKAIIEIKAQINSCPKDTPLNEEIEPLFVKTVVNSMENNSFVTKSNDNTFDIQLKSEEKEQILNENVFNLLDIKSDDKECEQLLRKEKKQ